MKNFNDLKMYDIEDPKTGSYPNGVLGDKGKQAKEIEKEKDKEKDKGGGGNNDYK